MTKVVIDMTMSLDGFVAGTYDITNGWGGAHPVNSVPVFVLTHSPPPADTVPKGPSNLTFVTDGIAEKISATDGPLATHVRYWVLNK